MTELQRFPASKKLEEDSGNTVACSSIAMQQSKEGAVGGRDSRKKRC